MSDQESTEAAPEVPAVEAVAETPAPVLSIEEQLAQLAQKVEDQGIEIAQLKDNVQGGFAQVNGVMHQLAIKINSIDPNRPMLEVTICQNDPEVTPPAERKFKATLLTESHPDPNRAGKADVLELVENEQKVMVWAPITLVPALSEYLTAIFKARNVQPTDYKWVRIREIKRPVGRTEDFVEGEDDTQVVAANDESAPVAPEVAEPVTG